MRNRTLDVYVRKQVPYNLFYNLNLVYTVLVKVPGHTNNIIGQSVRLIDCVFVVKVFSLKPFRVPIRLPKFKVSSGRSVN